ncbi:MAG: penicillin-binding protein 2 [Alphaproteobacteria bacterium]|nr:penicillin-binding protein 2 [Alphaproteobacteria bacterium]
MIATVAPKARGAFLYPGDELKSMGPSKIRLDGIAVRAVEIGRMRLIVTASLFALAFGLIGARLVELMVVGGDPSLVVARGTTTTAAVSQRRADIVDRNGVLIATNLPTVDLFADAQKVIDPKNATKKLIATMPELKRDEVLRKLSSGQRFVYLRRHLTPNEQASINALGIPGVDFVESSRRVYPHGSLFAHVAGVTDPDNHGNAGAEKAFDEILRRDQAPLALSLDVRVQHAVREALAAGITRFSAVAGNAVVMDANTGELVAMVSLPDFDPKDIGTASEAARFNGVTLGLYEMGSTFKLFTAAMALDSGTATLASRYDATEPIKIGRFTIQDFHAQNRWMDVPDVLIHSSNIGAAKIALQAGTEAQKAFLRKIGLLTPLALELPEVGTPQYPRTWREINTITIAYGHGISVTPVHVASAVSALVNGGTLHAPTIVRRDTGDEVAARPVISKRTSDAIRALMRMIVIEGSGKQADVAGYLVGGKTGSAEKVTRRGGYAENSRRTSFVAAFPITAPRYVVLVVLDEPRAIKETYGFATAGWNAAPTAGAIIAKISPMLGVFPIGHDDTFEPLAGILASRSVGRRAPRNEYASREADEAPRATDDSAPGVAIAAETTADAMSAIADAAGGTGEVE